MTQPDQLMTGGEISCKEIAPKASRGIKRRIPVRIQDCLRDSLTDISYDFPFIFNGPCVLLESLESFLFVL